MPEFVFLLGGQDYSGWSTLDGLTWQWMAFRDGVGAATSTRCQPLPVAAPLLTLANGNTAITVPPSTCCHQP